MQAINRRGFLRSMFGAAAVVTIATTAGVTLLPRATEAAMMPVDKNLPKAMEDFVEDAQYWYGRRRRVYRRYYRRRRRVYRRYWRRSRRVYRRSRRWSRRWRRWY